MSIRIPNALINAANLAARSEKVFIDLTQQVKSAQIVRRGFQVPAVKVDLTKVQQVIGDLIAVDPKVLPRVVSQSIQAGVKVSAGTSVDLVLAPRSAIPFDLFEGVHLSFKGKMVDQVDPIATNAEARKILLTYENPQDIPAAEKTLLTQVFNQNQVPIDETSTDTGFNAAFNSMRNAMAFQE
jgi:hypothetical protein